MGTRGIVRRFFRSSLKLKGGGQYADANNTLSSGKAVNWGVPQGIVLFLVYINELYDIEIRGNIISFADDKIIVYGVRSQKLMGISKKTW